MMNTIDIFPWDEQFNTGLPSIDAQHKKLVQILNELARHVVFQAGRMPADSLIDALIDYTEYHFREEERVWATYLSGDHLETAHRAAHAGFRAQIDDFRSRQNGLAFDDLANILSFLCYWLAYHILHDDRHMASLVLALQSGHPVQSAKNAVNEETCRAAGKLMGSLLAHFSANSMAMMREISAHRKTVEQLLESEAEHKAVIDSTSDLIWSVDAETYGLRTFNAGLYDYFKNGFGITIKPGMRPQDLFQSIEYVETWQRHYQRALTDGSYTMDYVSFAGRRHLILNINPLVREGKVFGISVFAKDISERRQAELALERDQARQLLLREILETVIAGKELVETLHTCLQMLLNQTSLGLAPFGEVSIGNPGKEAPKIISLYPAQDQLADLSLIRRVIPLIADGTAFGQLVIYPSPDAQASEGSEHFIASVADIMAAYIRRKNLEAELDAHRVNLEEQVRHRTHELSQSEARTRAILKTMLDGVIQIDQHGQILMINEAAQGIFGYRREELIGKSASLLMPASYRQAHQQGLANYGVTTHSSVIGKRIEMNGLRKNGEIFPLELSISVLQDEEGRSFIGGLRDLTENKAAAARLRDSEVRFAATFEQAAVGIGLFSLDGRWLRANQKVCEMLGYHEEELQAFSVDDLTHPEDQDASERDRQLMLSGEAQKITREKRYLRKDGTAIWADRFTTLIRKIDGTPDYFVSVIADIQTRKEAEQVLIEARKMAESVAKSKSDFLANMSHEIRTPLNGVLGLAQIGYRDSEGRDKSRETFGLILESGRLLLTVLNDILDFSKIEAGKLSIESLPYEPGALIQGAARTLAMAATGKKLPIIVENAPDLPRTCLGDPVRISQILFNLLSNAIKFTHAGQVRITAERDGQQLRFKVIDSGIGMAPDVLKRLFMPFEQADNSTTRQYGGTGLGLAISLRLATLMEGSLTVSSELGKGSTFVLTLPLQETDLIAESSLPADTHKLHLDGLHILVAEDNEVNCLVIEDMLQAEGAHVEIVGNGQLAVEAVAANPNAYHLVLMDVQMPVLNGIEATRQLRRIAPDLPVIGQTAHALQEEHERCRAAGMVATITKPIELIKLLNCIQANIQLPHARQIQASDITTSEPLIMDWPGMLSRYRHRQGFILRLIEIARKGLAEKIEALRSITDDADHQILLEIAHALKGNAGNICAPELERLARESMSAVDKQNQGTAMLARQLTEAAVRLDKALALGIPEACWSQFDSSTH